MTGEENWDAFLRYRNNIPETVVLNKALIEAAPLENKNLLVLIEIKMNIPQEDGLTSDIEEEALFKIEDYLVPVLDSDCDAVFAGRVSGSGVRNFYFYFPPDKFDHGKISDAFSHFPNYNWTVKHEPDPEWKIYKNFLFPTRTDELFMNNIKVIESLTKEGDSLIVPRQVDHWIYFSNQDELEQFWNEAKKMKFKLESKNVIKDDKYPYELHISKKSAVERLTINILTKQLLNLAQKYNGDYDGWETYLVR